MAPPIAPSATKPSIFATISQLASKHEAINLGQGFPDFEPDVALTDLLAKHIKQAHNQYAPLAGVNCLLEAIADKVMRCHQLSLKPDTEITVTSGATQAIWTAVQAVVNPGDEVIIFEPAYDSYAPAVKSKGGIVVPVVLEGPSFRPNWNRFAERLNARTKLVIINNPHNPSGTCWDREDLETLAQLLAPTNILLLSDEVYEHLVYDGRQHICALTLPGLRDRTFVTASFGKTFHVTGWKVGYILAHPILMQHYRAVHQFTVFAVNTPAQYAIADYLSDASHYLSLPHFFQAKRDLLYNALSDSGLKLLPSGGSYFGVADYSEVSDEEDTSFAERLIINHGVAVLPISPFYTNAPANQRYVRLCFAKRPGTLLSAAERICEATIRV